MIPSGNPPQQKRRLSPLEMEHLAAHLARRIWPGLASVQLRAEEARIRRILETQRSNP